MVQNGNSIVTRKYHSSDVLNLNIGSSVMRNFTELSGPTLLTLMVWIAWKGFSSSTSKLNSNSKPYESDFFASYCAECP